ncbi:hypothetical protein N0V93_006057 [Gnomoniopsis smithogilvyi]|uniref:Protein kinase domain-containing protein n=1 Tax=Gnomoniopsis smithogilvyi TaxID=1191159 RepID=A0A9W8YP48_9PEZI|nr:hypothetical protein N0V93_006057 [Gnomoniopsis smithogilvyi]
MSPKGSSTESSHDEDPTIPEIRVRAATMESEPQPSATVEGQLARVALSESNDDSSRTSAQRLERQLWQIAVKNASQGMMSFWPTPMWQAMVTQKSIADELIELEHNFDQTTAATLADKILGSGLERGILVFTILLLLGKLDDVPHILQQCASGGIRDHNLPVTMEQNVELLHRQGNPIAGCCIGRWLVIDLENFARFQRRLMPPVFGMDDDDHTLVHLELDKEDILPWCEVEDYLIPVNAMSGGYGTVSRVRIHPMCHKFGKTLSAINVADGLFAVKKLKQKDREKFDAEVKALSRFNGKVHKHLVTLLATFTQEGYYHMIFPWAQYDLDKYWEQNPNPDISDVGLVRWVSKQCLGMMEAISLVHNPNQHLTSAAEFGRHGDIKAENILWYKSNDPHNRGILVISDFGLAAINTAKSRSMMPNNSTDLRVTPSYRPPECDTEGGKITRAFDVWSLGCLYLELVCWLLRGTRGKEEFDAARTTTFISGANVDIFFDIKRSGRDSAMYVFTVKEVVSRTMSELHGDPKCTDWIHDLLDLVEKHMLLVVSPEHQRKSASYLAAELREMDRKMSDMEYCLSRKPEDRLARWTEPPGVLSELNETARRSVAQVRPELNTYRGTQLHRSLMPNEWKD